MTVIPLSQAHRPPFVCCEGGSALPRFIMHGAITLLLALAPFSELILPRYARFRIDVDVHGCYWMLTVVARCIEVDPRFTTRVLSESNTHYTAPTQAALSSQLPCLIEKILPTPRVDYCSTRGFVGVGIVSAFANARVCVLSEPHRLRALSRELSAESRINCERHLVHPGRTLGYRDTHLVACVETSRLIVEAQPPLKPRLNTLWRHSLAGQAIFLHYPLHRPFVVRVLLSSCSPSSSLPRTTSATVLDVRCQF